MKFVRDLENMFEKYIEGFFNNKFSSGLQPVEIGKQLVRKMDDEKTVGISKTYAPNSYIVHLNNADYNRIVSYSQTICEELAHYLAEQAQKRQYTIVGAPIIEFVEDVTITKGNFRVVASFSEPLPEENHIIHEDSGGSVESDTRIFDKIECDWPRQPSLLGILKVMEGPDTGIKVEVRANRINIGRRASNELPLTDLNTSRLQAYVIVEDGKHIIHDAKSLNGTYVNNHRIACKELETGDYIKMGNTVILYEVN